MIDGRKPESEGWNRISLEVSDLAATAEALHKEGGYFRNDVALPECPLWLADSYLESAPTVCKRDPNMIWPLVILIKETGGIIDSRLFPWRTDR